MLVNSKKKISVLLTISMDPEFEAQRVGKRCYGSNTQPTLPSTGTITWTKT